MKDVDRHVSLLGLLFGLCGLLGLLVAAALLVLALGAAAISSEGSVAAGLTAILFGLSAALVLAWAGACLWGGRALRRRQPWGRLAGLVLGVLNLFVLPLGTALGIYSLWVLLQEDARRLFEPAASPAKSS